MEDWGYGGDRDGDKVVDDDTAVTDNDDWGYLIFSFLYAGLSCICITICIDDYVEEDTKGYEKDVRR